MPVLPAVRTWKVRPCSLPTTDIFFDKQMTVNEVKQYIHEVYGRFRYGQETFTLTRGKHYELFICRVVDRYVTVSHSPMDY